MKYSKIKLADRLFSKDLEVSHIFSDSKYICIRRYPIRFELDTSIAIENTRETALDYRSKNYTYSGITSNKTLEQFMIAEKNHSNLNLAAQDRNESLTLKTGFDCNI